VEFSYNDSTNKSTGQLMYGMQPRGVFELRNLEESEFRSVGAEDFAAEM
jgi:hypothetical protein